MSASRANVIRTYRKRARHYDLTANLYYLFGFREWAYRRRAVQAMRLRPGDTVVEVGCGTGLNFGLLEQAVGPAGRIVGIDLTDSMLAHAQQRVQEHGWSNVTLVQADAAAFEFPHRVHAILSTFALSLVPECAAVIQHGCEALTPGGYWVVLDLKLPGWAPRWLRRLVMPIVRPFAVDDDIIARRPWKTIRRAMEVELSEVSWTELFFGFAYAVAGAREQPT
jgi:ubiquinone/menaquinone biosynthesis C-methylase UbiE